MLSSKARRRGLHLRQHLPAALRAVQDEAGPSEFPAIELGEGFVFCLAPVVLAGCGVNHFGKPPAFRLDPDSNLQIIRNLAARQRIYKYDERSGADIRVGPERNDAWSEFLAFGDRERR